MPCKGVTGTAIDGGTEKAEFEVASRFEADFLTYEGTTRPAFALPGMQDGTNKTD